MDVVRLRPDPASDQEIELDVLIGRQPTLVYLHGMTSARVGHKSGSLLALSRRLGLGFCRFDMRGHGASDGEVASITISDLLTDTRAVAAHVGPCVLIGSSLGGLVAAWTAALHGASVAALVLLSPALGFLPQMAKQAESYEVPRGQNASMVFDRRVLEDARQYDESGLPARLELPVLLAHGSEDDTVPVAVSRTFAGAIPASWAEFHCIEGGSHSLNEDFDEVSERIASFLAARQLL